MCDPEWESVCGQYEMNHTHLASVPFCSGVQLKKMYTRQRECFFTHFMGGQMYQATAKVGTQTLVRDEASLGQLDLVTMVERLGAV